jgi:UDP-glucose 4-epimerase
MHQDYIHVTDLADAQLKALKYLENGGKSEVFNLGNGNGFSVKQVIEKPEK